MRRRALLLAASAMLAVPAKAEDAIPCERSDCRLIVIGATATLLGWTQETDKYGAPLHTSRDPNTYTETKLCYACGRKFTRKYNATGVDAGWVEVQ